MTFVWVVFTTVLFVLEPLFLHRYFVTQARKNPERAFALLQTMHWILLGVSLLAIVGAVGGTRGYLRL
jgi:peptidoglycan biosynthesis protein MviN/MurJ (putative lipid II flippase)